MQSAVECFENKMSVSAKIVISYEEYKRLLSIAEKYEALIQAEKGNQHF